MTGLLAVALAACFACHHALPVSASGDEVDDCLALLERLDASLTTVNFRETPLAQVIDDLNTRFPAPVRVDWPALIRLGVHTDDRITLRLDEARLSTVLGGLMLMLGDEYERPMWDIARGQIIITTLRATEAMRLTATYDVRDLLAAGVLDRVRDVEHEDLIPGAIEGHNGEDDEAHDPSRAGDDDGMPLVEHTPYRRLSPAEELAALVMEHVDPDAWQEMGGSLARISDAGGVLLVTAPPRTHHRFRDALQQLRRSFPTGVSVEAVLLRVPRAALERLNRRFETGSIGLARAVEHAESAERLWAARVITAFDESAAVRTEADDALLELELLARLNRETGVLQLHVNAASQRTNEKLSYRGAVSVPAMNGAAMIELPSDARSEDVAVLLLIPQRY